MSATGFVLMTLLSFTLAAALPQSNTWDQQQGQFRPFGSDRPCSSLINDTLAQNENQVIIERILITADTMGNSFAKTDGFNAGSSPQLDTWASQTCGQMQNIIGYLKSACQYSTSGNVNNPTELVAIKKLAAMSSVKDYLCQNSQVYLKEMAMNNGAQCARRTDMSDFGCNNIQLTTTNFVSMLPSRPRQVQRYGTSIILSMMYYNSDECRYLNDITSCIQDKYNRGTEFCSYRAARHYNNIFGLMLQGVQCNTYTGFNNAFDPNTAVNFNSNTNFQRYPSNSFSNSNAGSNSFGFNNNNNNNWPSNSNFPQQGSNNWNSGFGTSGSNSFGFNNNNNNNNWPSNSNFPNTNLNSQGTGSFGQGSNTFGQNNFGQGTHNFGSDSGLSFSGTIPPYNPSLTRRPYYYRNSGNVSHGTTATLIIITLFTAYLAV